MFLDNFKDDFLYNKPLKYWYYEWLVSSKEIENGLMGIDIVNVRVILKDMISEYELNKFESDNNRKVYLGILGNIIKEQYIQSYRDCLLILKDKLETGDFQSVYIISKELYEKISLENFSQIIFDEIFSIVKRSGFQKKQRTKIKKLTKDLIIELSTSGHDIKDIQNMFKKAFDTYFIHGDGKIILYEYVPPNLNLNEKLAYIDNLTIKKRLEIFRDNLSPNLTDFTFIFPIWGMIAPHGKNTVLFDIEIYNPLEKKMAINNNEILDETFRLNLDKEPNPSFFSKCNAIVKTQAISASAAQKNAEEKLSTFLNFINLKFGSKFQEFYWDGQYIGRENHHNSISFGTFFGYETNKINRRRSVSKNSPFYLKPTKLKHLNKYSDVIELLQNKNMFFELNTIINVSNLLYKSLWEPDETRLLNYWICLESLANISKKNKDTKFNFIKNTLSNIYLLHEQYEPVKELFLLTDFYASQNDEAINIPNEFLKNVGIYTSRNEDAIVSLITFKNRMEELLEYTSNESFLDNIEDTLSFYKDNKVALKRLLNKKAEVKLTIDYIYKSRNQIVHNGFIEKSLIPHLVNYAEAYANCLFDLVIGNFQNNEFDLQKYFIKKQYEGDLLEKKLSGNEFYIIPFE